MSHYYDEQPESKLVEQVVPVRFKTTDADTIFEFKTASGIFSKDHVDTATRLLMDTAYLPKEGTVADLGCGWGVVGIWVKYTSPNLNVISCDINERAIVYTKKNAKIVGVNIEVIQSNVLEKVPNDLDTILANPPYAAGRQICYDFITQSYEKLNSSGKLFLVARHTKGGKMLKKRMEETFGNAETMNRSGGFHVYCSQKN